MATSRVVLTERRGSALIITLARPERRNAVDQAVSTQLSEALDELDGTTELAVGVLTGADGTFCSGMDLKAAQHGETANVLGRGFAGIVERPPAKPLIAAVEGWALGGGFEVALACDLIVASERATFGLPEVRRGIVAAGGGVLRLPERIPRSIAMELILTGDDLPAPRAAELGLVNRLAPAGQALDVALALAEVIAANAPMAVIASKRVATEAPGWDRASAFARQQQVFAPVFASADATEGACAFTEKRAPIWTGR